MAITICVALQKGGVGKTTTAEALSAIIGKQGKRVLLVDMDSQTNSTFISGADPEKTITDVFAGESTTRDAICHCDNYDLLAADEYLANFETLDVDPIILKECIAEVDPDYDYILIDTPPALGNLLKASLVASKWVIIPTDARPLSIKGLDALEATIKAAQSVSKDLKILGIVLVKFNERTVLNRQIKGLLEERCQEMNTTVFDAKIREGVAVAEAQAMQQSLIDYAPKSKPCLDYVDLANEIMAKAGGV